MRPAALITGASTGIGLELARLFAADRKDLVLVARDREKLARVADELTRQYGIRVDPMAKDLADREAPISIAEELETLGVSVEELVNNAGMGVYGPFAKTDLARELDVIQVNVTALTQLTKFYLPEMLRGGRGRIMNVSSTAAFQPGPLMAVYYATKAYVLSFTEALANETRGTGVTVTALCPGPTITEFQRRAGMGDTRLFHSPLVMKPAEVAKVGYQGMQDGKTLVIPGLMNKLLVQGVRLMPRKLVTQAARRIQEKRSRPPEADPRQ